MTYLLTSLLVSLRIEKIELQNFFFLKIETLSVVVFLETPLVLASTGYLQVGVAGICIICGLELSNCSLRNPSQIRSASVCSP